MARCQKIRRKNRRVCVGDLDTLIVIQNRNLSAPEFSAVDFNEDFDGDLDVWAAINTVTGKTFFDGVSVDTQITHEILIQFEETVTASSWVLLDGTNRLDILNVEDLEERHEFMLLTCTDRGLAVNEASKA